jgi:hypothetical protein
MNSPLGTSSETRPVDRSPVLARALGAAALLFAGLFVVATIIAVHAQSNNGLTAFAGLTAGAVILRLAVAHAGQLRLALIAQAADLLTFVFAWQDGEAEHNPLAGWVVDTARGALPPDAVWLAPLLAGLFLILLKVGLAVLLIAVAQHLGRYRTLVLTIAIAAGLIGAVSNLLALPWSSLFPAAARS